MIRKSKYDSSKFLIEFNNKESDIVCIYYITNMLNNKIYIGQTLNFVERATRHRRELFLNKHYSKHLQKSYNLGNTFEIKILEICEIDELDNKEIFWISLLNTTNKKLGYNIYPGGNSLRGYVQSKESNQKRSNSLKGRKPNIESLCKPVLSYDSKTGKFVKEYVSISETARQLNVRISSVSSSLLKQNFSIKNLIFKYKTDEFFQETIDLIPNSRRDLKKKIVQRDLENNIIKVWTSREEISKHLNLTLVLIRLRLNRGYTIYKDNYKYNYI